MTEPTPASVQEWRNHLGRKVSLRYRLRGDPAHPFSEAIGVIQSVGTDEAGTDKLVILNRRADTVEVPIDDVLAAKLFPV
jgi:ribosome maturation factor RimP